MGLGDVVVPATTRVRRAKMEDLDWLVEELRKFSSFFGSKRSLFGDEAFVRQAMKHFVAVHVVFVAERSDIGRVGFIAGAITPHPFNPEIKVCAETFWWVAEEHRGSRAAAMLLTVFLRHGEENADWITFGLEARSPVKAEALEKRGFKLQEQCFLLEVEK